jgi:hypothetical protein
METLKVKKIKNNLKIIVFLFLSLFIFSGCDFFDRINEYLLDITGTKSTADDRSSIINTNDSTNDDDTTDDSNSNGDDSTNSNTTDDSNSNGDDSTDDDTTDDSNSNSDDSTNGDNTTDDSDSNSDDSTNGDNTTDDSSLNMFELLFVDTPRAKYHEFNLSFLKSETLELKTVPAQSGTPLTITSTNDYLFSYIDSNESEGTYDFKVIANKIEGSAEFNLTVNNGNYEDSVFLYVTVKTPIEFYSVRNEYIVYLNDEKNITVNVKNTVGNGLNISVQDFDMHNDADSNISVTTSENLYLSGTEDGIDFNLNIQGLKETNNHYLTIMAKDIVTEKTDYFTIYIVVVDKYPNLAENSEICGESGIDLSRYQTIQDANDPSSPGGTTDTHFQVTSHYEVDSALNVEYTRVLVYYPTKTAYSQDLKTYYFYANNEKIATFEYSKTLAQEEIYIKYYDDEAHEIVCKTAKLPISY